MTLTSCNWRPSSLSDPAIEQTFEEEPILVVARVLAGLAPLANWRCEANV